MRTTIVALVLAGAASLSAAQAPTREELAGLMHRWTAGAFDLGSLPVIDPELRRQGEAMAAAHLARADELAAKWLDRELVATNGVITYGVSRGGAAWLTNELAAWRVDSLGPEDDALQRRMLTAPGVCRRRQGLSEFAGVLVQIDALPAAERARAVELERDRLARWGGPRSGLPQWPQPLPLPQIEAALVEARKAGGRAEPPMSPILASALFVFPEKSPLETPGARCEALRWWLQRAGEAPEALALARLASMPLPAAPPPPPEPEAADAYPRLARAFEITGAVDVQVKVGAEGKAVDPRVEGRRVLVPGLQGQRPIAFETVFDDATIARARMTRIEGVEGATKTVEFQWMLR